MLGTAAVKVAPRRPGDKGRTATVAIKAGTVTIKRPKTTPNRDETPALTLGLVEVREVVPTGRKSKEARQPLLWRLVTTLPVATLADAQDVVRLYRLRWRIEEVFRVLKSDGLDIEESQLETAGRLLNLAALGLVAAARIIQLVDARDGSSRPATDVIEPEEIEAAAAISATLEGSTERQKNHHPPGSLAWLAWITARLGGWNCYYKPPGPRPCRAASIVSSSASKVSGLETGAEMCESGRGLFRGSKHAWSQRPALRQAEGEVVIALALTRL